MTTTTENGSNESAPPEKDELIFTTVLPRGIADLLDAEAAREQRSRRRQLVRVLEERYGLLEKNGAAQEAAN